MATQWIYSAMGEPVGLRYEVLPVVLRAERVERGLWPDVMDDLQVMEWHALASLRKKG